MDKEMNTGNSCPQPQGEGRAYQLLYKSSELFKQKQEILIEHEGELYRLRITRNGKLIMNK